MCSCSFLGVLLQDTFTVERNAFSFKPVFLNHSCETNAKNSIRGVCSKDWFQSHMTIHFQKAWLDDHLKNNSINRAGSILGFAYGREYWSPATIASCLPNEAIMQQCRDYYAL